MASTTAGPLRGRLSARLSGPPRRVRPAPSAVLTQVAVLVGAVLVYFGVRGLTESDRASALRHADGVIGLERWLGIHWEPALQHTAARYDWLVTAMNWVYIWGHWPVIVSVLAWLLVRNRPVYAVIRNALLISGLIGMVIFVLFPVAPPRLTSLDVVDTITQQSRSYRVLQPPAFVNQYAAVPSLHFGWDLLIGITLVAHSRRRVLRLAGALMPLAMLAAIVLTANHYLLDAVVGGAVALTGLAVAVRRAESGAARAAGGPVPAAPTGRAAVALPRPRHPGVDSAA